MGIDDVHCGNSKIYIFKRKHKKNIPKWKNLRIWKNIQPCMENDEETILMQLFCLFLNKFQHKTKLNTPQIGDPDLIFVNVKFDENYSS